MSKLIIPALGLVLAMAAPAFAETGAQQHGTSSGMSQGATSGTSTKSAQNHSANQERLKKTLSEAGFKDVRIVDESFLVQAQTKDGDPVIMLVNPPGPSVASTGGTSAGSTGIGSAGSSSGATASPSGAGTSGTTSK